MPDMVQKNTLGILFADAERTIWNSGNSIGLYTNDLVPSPTMVNGDFVESTYGGYARQSFSFGPTFVDPAGNLTQISDNQFNSVAGGSVNVVKGVFVVDGSGNPLEAGNLGFDAGMGGLAQALRVVIENRGGVLSLISLPSP